MVLLSMMDGIGAVLPMVAALPRLNFRRRISAALPTISGATSNVCRGTRMYFLTLAWPNSPLRIHVLCGSGVTSFSWLWQGWLYLAVVIDLFSRKIVGWAAKPTIHRELVLEALMKAVRSRRPHTLGSRNSVRERRLAALLQESPSRTKHEQARKLLGQRSGRVFLQQPEKGTY